MDPIPLQAPRSLVFWRRADVALARVEYAGRIEVTSRTGEVLHRPGPLSLLAGPPLSPLGPEILANSQLAQRDGDAYIFPGGWRLVPSVPLKPNPPPPPPPEKTLPGGVRPSEVLYLRGASARATWYTDRGPIPAGAYAEAAARAHPTLVKAGRGTYVNKLRLREIRNERKQYAVILDDGTRLTVSFGARQALADGLGLPQLEFLEPTSDAARILYQEGMRDWPWELFNTPAAALRQAFGSDERRCQCNVLWQTFRYREQGRDVDNYGRSERGYWYVPMFDVLSRAGFMAEKAISASIFCVDLGHGPPLELLARGLSDAHYSSYLALIAQMVGDWRLFTFEQLGFQEPRPELRRIGQKSPQVVLMAEKNELQRGVRAIAERHDVSTIILGGLPSLLSTEFFARALRPAIHGPIILMAYVDFDPGGWIAITGFIQQLARYGVEVARVGHLVLPSRFTAEEIALHSYPLPATTPQIGGKIKEWLAETGGIHGKPRGMHADLLPVDRVLAAWDEEMAKPRRPSPSHGSR